jgi:hypothetical protein
LQEDNRLRLEVELSLGVVNGMEHCVERRRIVGRELSGPHDDCASEAHADIDDLAIVARENHRIQTLAGEAGLDRVLDKGLSAELDEVLPGDALGAPARGDDAEILDRRQETASATALATRASSASSIRTLTGSAIARRRSDAQRHAAEPGWHAHGGSPSSSR